MPCSYTCWKSARRRIRSFWRNLIHAERRALFAADCETLAALGASPLQHEPAVFRAHSDQKSVCPLAPAGVRLKCALTLHEPSFRGRNEPSMLSNGFEQCQCDDRLCYSRRPSKERSDGNARPSPWAFGLSPKFSTPVEKTVEKRRETSGDQRRKPVCCGSRAGRNRRIATGWASRAPARSEVPRNRQLRRAKPRRSRLC